MPAPAGRRDAAALTFLYALLVSLALVIPVRAAVPVTVTAASEMPINRTLQLTGSVTPQRQALLSPATSGLVATLLVEEGSEVARDDPLLTLDAELAGLELESARAQADRLREALADARRRLEEASALKSRQSIAESTIRDLAAEVEQDRAALRQAEADASLQKAIVERHTVKAPFNGVISRKLTEVGEWITPGDGVLELVTVARLRLDFLVAEDYLPAVTAGTPIRFTLGAQPERSYHGEVATVVPVSDPTRRTFLLRVLAPDSAEVLRPGMSVRATLQVDTGRRGVVVPRDATLRHPDGRTVVWTVENVQSDAVARENVVRTGLEFDGLVEIREGLSAGASVVIHGNESLQNGQRVEPRETGA